MYSSSSKPKLKIDPLNMDFDFMIKNHPEFFTKLSTRDNIPEPPFKMPALALGACLTCQTLRADIRPSEEWEARHDIKTENISINGEA
jgi:hypothetical protein